MSGHPLRSLGADLEQTLDAPRDVHIGKSGTNGEPSVRVQMASSTSIHGIPVGTQHARFCS